MVSYLSDEWMERAGEALAGSEALAEATKGVDLVVQYDVSGAPGGTRSYALCLRDGSVSLEPGPHPDAHVSFTLDYGTAAEIARGDRSAQAAFMRGDLKLTGDVMVLVHQQGLLGAVDDALAELRADTEF